MHLEIATRTNTTPPALQLQAPEVSTVFFAKNPTNGRMTLSIRSGNFPQTMETYEAYETVLARYASAPAGSRIARISPEDLATAQGNV